MNQTGSGDTPSKYWLDRAADEIVSRYPKGEIIISSGISPSAFYHIGHFREIMTSDALAWAVRQRGRKARHIHIVDNLDPLRRRYDFLPEEFDQYVGQPVCLIPDPVKDGHDSYADHYYADFEKYLKPMGLGPEILRSYEDLYKPGNMTPYIEMALEKSDLIREIFKRVSNRDLPDDWTPVQVINEKNGMFANARIDSWDKKKQTIEGVDYTSGRAKLNWRLDWPARWAYLGVQVEPFGAQEHGAAGGSYDTAVEFAEKIFAIRPPFDAARYGHIHLVGDTKKMSSSSGNVVTPAEALQIMPAEILRYFIVRSLPEKKLIFDSGIGLYNLIDEFAAAQDDPQHEFRDAYNFAVAGKPARVISSVPFKHLVQVYQAARGGAEKTLEVLSRTGYQAKVKTERENILAELKFVQNWLAKYAPEEVKFSVQEKLPPVKLNDQQQAFTKDLADSIEAQKGDIDGQRMHELIYAAKDLAGLENAEAFRTLYRLILDKDYGPKAGWFLSSLDKNWLLKRLKQAA